MRPNDLLLQPPTPEGNDRRATALLSDKSSKQLKETSTSNLHGNRKCPFEALMVISDGSDHPIRTVQSMQGQIIRPPHGEGFVSRRYTFQAVCSCDHLRIEKIRCPSYGLPKGPHYRMMDSVFDFIYQKGPAAGGTDASTSEVTRRTPSPRRDKGIG